EIGRQIAPQPALELLSLRRGKLLQRREPGLSARTPAFSGLAPGGQDRPGNDKGLMRPVEVAARAGDLLRPEWFAMRLRRAGAGWRAKADRGAAGDQAREV